MMDDAEIHFWGPLGVCWGWDFVQRPFVELNASFYASLGVQLKFLILFWRWTPELGRELALNASLRRLSLCKVWTIIYCWKALDVYFPMQLEARHFEFCSSRKSIFECREVRIQQHQQSFFNLNQIFAQLPQFQPEKYLKLQKNTQLIVKSRNMNFS